VPVVKTLANRVTLDDLNAHVDRSGVACTCNQWDGLNANDVKETDELQLNTQRKDGLCWKCLRSTARQTLYEIDSEGSIAD
jgi:hypothetical protein